MYNALLLYYIILYSRSLKQSSSVPIRPAHLNNVIVTGPTNRQHLSGHRHRQRDVGPVLRARRVHGRRGRRSEGVVRRQRPVVVGRGETKKIRHAYDRPGEPVPGRFVGGHQVLAVRGTRTRAGGYRHIPWCGHRGRGQSDVPEESVAR